MSTWCWAPSRFNKIVHQINGYNLELWGGKHTFFAQPLFCNCWKMFKPVLPIFFFFFSAVSWRSENLSFIFPYVNSAFALGTLCHCVIAGLVAIFVPEEMQPCSISAVVAWPHPLVFSSRTLRESGGRTKVNLRMHVFLVLLVQYRGSWHYLSSL